MLASSCTWVVSLWYAVLSPGFTFARLMRVDRIAEFLFGISSGAHLQERVTRLVISTATWSWILFATAVAQLIASFGLLVARGGGLAAVVAVVGFAVCLLDTLVPGIDEVHQLDALSLVGSFVALPAALAVRRQKSA